VTACDGFLLQRGERQLCLPDIFTDIKNADLVVNQPVKEADPVLTYDRAWEGNCVTAWGSVLRSSSGAYEFWYQTYNKYAAPGEQTYICYASSNDGRHWEKPALGLVDYMGSTANNIVVKALGDFLDSPTVIKRSGSGGNSTAHPEQPYLMFRYESAHKGIVAAASPDGRRWRDFAGICVAAGDRCTAMYHESLHKYHIITRVPGRNVRTCGLWESEDLRTWTFTKEVLEPDMDDVEAGMGADGGGKQTAKPETEFYGLYTFRWGGVYLGYLELFHVAERTLDSELVYSRDGYSWQRTRQIFLPRGGAGCWDQAWVFPAHNPPLAVGNKLFIYYQGRQTRHWADPPYGHIGSIGLATLRPDGFVSLDAQNQEGVAVTRPFTWPDGAEVRDRNGGDRDADRHVGRDGDTLYLNACARPGYIQVDVLDENGTVIPSFAAAGCSKIEMVDSCRIPVRWENAAARLRGLRIRLRFTLRGAKLFAFWVE